MMHTLRKLDGRNEDSSIAKCERKNRVVKEVFRLGFRPWFMTTTKLVTSSMSSYLPLS